MIVARVINDAGRAFNVRLVRQGERYGLDGCLVHKGEDPMIEWYDATYENDPRFTLGLGQFCSRYNLGTLTGQDRYSRCDHRKGSPGIDLCGHVPEWKVTGPNVVEALAAIERALAPAISRCSVCGIPAHASETDDLDRCADCIEAVELAASEPGYDPDEDRTP